MRLLTALGLTAALLLSAQPVTAFGQSLQESRIRTGHSCDASGSCEYSIPPEYQTQYLACRLSGQGWSNISRLLYCANLYSHMAPPAPISTLTPITTPTPAPSSTPREVDCRVSAGRLSYEGSYNRRQEYSLQLGTPSFSESPCVNEKVTWCIEYPSGKIRREKKKISLSGSSFLYLERNTKAVAIWVVRSNGAETTGCYPKERWCD